MMGDAITMSKLLKGENGGVDKQWEALWWFRVISLISLIGSLATLNIYVVPRRRATTVIPLVFIPMS